MGTKVPNRLDASTDKLFSHLKRTTRILSRPIFSYWFKNIYNLTSKISTRTSDASRRSRIWWSTLAETQGNGAVNDWFDKTRERRELAPSTSAIKFEIFGCFYSKWIRENKYITKFTACIAHKYHTTNTISRLAWRVLHKIDIYISTAYFVNDLKTNCRSKHVWGQWLIHHFRKT